jgi:hypothetical protein
MIEEFPSLRPSTQTTHKSLNLILYELIQATSTAGFPVETRELPLSEIGGVWSIDHATPRIVLTMS